MSTRFVIPGGRCSKRSTSTIRRRIRKAVTSCRPRSPKARDDHHDSAGENPPPCFEDQWRRLCPDHIAARTKADVEEKAQRPRARLGRSDRRRGGPRHGLECIIRSAGFGSKRERCSQIAAAPQACQRNTQWENTPSPETELK